MSIAFTKLFSSITESTIWLEPMSTRIVWITMLAMADRHGFVFGSVPGLAHRARVSVDECRAALRTLLAPDPDSRTKDHEGRRIAEIDGGWQLLNHAKYRAIQDAEAIRESKRNHMRRSRSVEPSGSNIPQWKSPSASVSSSDPDLSDQDPDQPDQVGSPPLQRELLPHELAEARAAAEPTGARPALRYEFNPDWRPKTTHRDLARQLGLTDEDVGERLHDCRNKAYPHGFPSEDKQFNRELAWAAREKETRTFKAQQLAARKANPHGFDENPGARRRPDDHRPEPVFGRIGAG